MAKVTTVMVAVLAVILAIVPFHALLTVGLSAVVGHYDLLRVWKELLLVVLTPLAAILVYRTPGLWKQLRSGWLLWAMASYVLLHIVLGGLALAKGEVNTFALGYALIINLRLILVFLLAWIAGAAAVHWLGANKLHDCWRWLLLWPAVAVISFGLLQAFVLPHDFLSHLGYGQTTIKPFETVDQKLDYVRIQSTLRGANPLGAYLVLVLTAAAVLLRRERRHGGTGLLALLVAGGLALLLTYSRSAYIGLFLVALVLVALAARSRATRRQLVWGAAIFAVLAAGGLALLRDNDRVQNALFHTDENSASVMSSNEQRASALQTGAGDLAAEPFGRGPGTAGPASAHNDRPGRIAENYYLQIGQETGWLGLGLFVAIVIMVGKSLWRRRRDPLARMLLVSLAGLSFINLVQHAWADDTLAVLWWGLAGVAMALPVAVDGKPGQKAKKKVKTHAEA